MTHGQKCIFVISCIYINLYIFKKKWLFLQENNEGIFIKMKSKINEGLNFQKVFSSNHIYYYDKIKIKIV